MTCNMPLHFISLVFRMTSSSRSKLQCTLVCSSFALENQGAMAVNIKRVEKRTSENLHFQPEDSRHLTFFSMKTKRSNGSGGKAKTQGNRPRGRPKAIKAAQCSSAGKKEKSKELIVFEKKKREAVRIEDEPIVIGNEKMDQEEDSGEVVEVVSDESEVSQDNFQISDFDKIEPQRIVEVVLDNGIMYYVAKVKNQLDCHYIPTSVMSVRWPAVVIEFYQSRIKWTDRNHLCNYSTFA